MVGYTKGAVDDLNTHKLTWAALLGRWIEFAQSALALPGDAEGQSWRASVPAIIGLQALCMALKEVDELPADERALGVDRARILLDRHTAGLREAFGPGELPAMLEELVSDARGAIEAAEGMGG